MSAVVFGKMPAHGDFVSRGLTPEQSERWDSWIAGEILTQRTALGDAFEDRFDHAPVWRFAVPYGDERLVGAMAPSADSVGRRFVLVAGRTAETLQPALAEACEDLLYQAFGENWTAPQLHAALDDCDVADTGDAAPAEWWTIGNDRFPEASRADAMPVGLLGLMLTPRSETV